MNEIDNIYGKNLSNICGSNFYAGKTVDDMRKLCEIDLTEMLATERTQLERFMDELKRKYSKEKGQTIWGELNGFLTKHGNKNNEIEKKKYLHEKIQFQLNILEKDYGIHMIHPSIDDTITSLQKFSEALYTIDLHIDEK